MAAVRPLSMGFSSTCRVARFQLGKLEVSWKDKKTGEWFSFTLEPELVRFIDLYLERDKHEASLLTMNGGVLGLTLCEAVQAGGERDTAFLLSCGADVDYPLEYLTALEWSAHNGHLVDRALYYSAYHGHTPVVALLLDRGAVLHDDDGEGEMCELFVAAENGHLDTVRLLLDRGADVHAQNEEALHRARRAGHESIIAVLVERGAGDAAEESFAVE